MGVQHVQIRIVDHAALLKPAEALRAGCWLCVARTGPYVRDRLMRRQNPEVLCVSHGSLVVGERLTSFFTSHGLELADDSVGQRRREPTHAPFGSAAEKEPWRRPAVSLVHSQHPASTIVGEQCL